MERSDVICAFHAMWDHFPEPVMLIKKNRQIYAVNPKAASLGLSDQIKCSSIGAPERHKCCLCNRAVDEARTVCTKYDGPSGKAFGYWMPFAGAEEYIIHFSAGAFSQPEN
ncbi:hypothetical protein [uncultured Selenomonas sp.]|uniref:hypothetical protein n=1 Tax=uncultured Selenomonas sp. TaxID=159275 RepID=UPI0028060993|nr:hypothetical protein [uncultured Selenomonas sp.]